MKSTRERGNIKSPSGTKLFHFTPKEEAMMRKAIASSIWFMRHYGKGRKPFSLVTDLTKYSYQS